MNKQLLGFAHRRDLALNILKVGVIFGLLWLYCWTMLDPDFGWHLAAGDYIRHHWVPAHDIYTYTARQFAWINHEWGSDVLVAIMYKIGGFWLLTTAFAGLWTAGLCLFRVKLRLSLLILALFAVLPYAGIRPAVWTFLGVTILLQLLSAKPKWFLLYIPLLFLAWANLHGGFIIGLAILGYYFVKYQKSVFLYAGALAFLATFINPYGPRLYIEIVRTLFDPGLHHQIAEWRSLYIPGTALVFVVIWGIGFWLYDKKPLTNWLGLTPLLLAASLSASRNVPLFVASSSRDLDRYAPQLKKPKHLDWLSKLMVASSLILLGTVFVYSVLVAYWPLHSREYNYPAQAVAYLRTHPCKGHLFNEYNYGGYIIWKLPGQPIYMDGRMPTWRTASGQRYLDRYFAVLSQKQTRQAEFSRYNIRCALINTRQINAKLLSDLQAEGWVATVKSPNGTLLLLAP
jgi:hypothetical protein